MNLWEIIGTRLFESFIGYVFSKTWVWFIGQFKWWRFSPWFKKYVVKVEQFTVSQRPGKPLGIQRIGKIERIEKEEILQGLQAHNQMFLLGAAGSGKTGIGWQVVDALKGMGQVVLYLDCSRISINQNILQYVQSSIDNRDDIEKALRMIGKKATVYCIIDQVDHLVRESQVSNLGQLLHIIKNIQGLRILLAVRDFDYGQSKELQAFGFPIVHSRELRVENAITYLASIGVLHPPDKLVSLAQNLFNLSLIAEIYASGRDIRDISGQMQLFEKYIEYIALDVGREAIERGIELARKHMASPQTNLEGSPSEQAIRALLSRGILLIDQLRKLRFRHELIEEYICAYGLLPTKPDLTDLLQEFGESSGRRIVALVIGIYHDKSPHDEVALTEAVLTNDLPFYFKATILDAVRFQPAPTPEMVGVVSRFLRTGKESYSRYFFQDLDNPAWVEVLHNQGYFYNAPPPQEDPKNPGYFFLPSWYAGEYLKAKASQFPIVIKEVALNLDTINAHAIRTMLEAIIKIPPEVGAPTVDAFEKWSKTSFAHGMMLAHEMGMVMEHLAKGGQADAALHVLYTLIEPIPMNDRYTDGKITANARHDLYWLNEAFSHNLPSLLNIDLVATTNTLEKRLIEAIDMEIDPHIPKEKYAAYSYWRLNIRPDLSRGQPRDLKDLLVNVLIRSLEESCNQGRSEVRDILSKYLDSPYAIFKRIAVYLMRIKGHQYRDLVEKAYQSWKTEHWAGGLDEFEHFLDAQYGVLSSASQEEILKAIYLYRDGAEFSKWADTVIEQNPDRVVGNSNDEKKARFSEEYEFRQLHRFSTWLTGETKKRYEELSKKYEKPAPRLESGVVITSWEPELSPVEIVDLDEKTVREVIQYLVDFSPSGEGFHKPSREGLAQVFRAEAKNRLGEFVENSSLLIRDDLPFVYHANFLAALEDAIKAGQRIQIGQVTELCEFIISAKKDNFEKQQYESGLPHAKLAIANLLEQLLRIEEPYIDNGLLGRIGQMILVLACEEDDPFLEQEIHKENPNEIDARTLNTNLDAATLSLNSIRGVAMHCLVIFALYSERKRKGEGGDQDGPVMVPLVRDALTEKLDKEGDSSEAVHAVLGWYFPQLMYLDKNWAINNLGRIFPLNRELIQYWIAAWSAYVRFSNVYTNVFPHLVDHYRLAIELLPRQKSQAFDRIDERLTEHLLNAYLIGLIDLGSGDGLLRFYYEKAPDLLRSHGNFWLSQVLQAQQPGKEDPAWIKIWSLWQWRIAEALKVKDKVYCQKEITSFCRFLENVPVELDVLFYILSKTTEFKDEGHFEIIQIVEYLAKNAEKHLKLAVGLLHKIVSNKLLSYLTSDNRNDIRRILELVKKSDDTKTRQLAVEIINILGEMGDYEWRRFLEDIE